MSEREQHEIIGRTVQEHREAKRKLAALEAKARSYAACMRAVARELHPVGEIHTAESAESILAQPRGKALDTYPSKTDVEALISELLETRAKVGELAQSLREMGV